MAQYDPFLDDLYGSDQDPYGYADPDIDRQQSTGLDPFLDWMGSQRTDPPIDDQPIEEGPPQFAPESFDGLPQPTNAFDPPPYALIDDYGPEGLPAERQTQPAGQGFVPRRPGVALDIPTPPDVAPQHVYSQDELAPEIAKLKKSDNYYSPEQRADDKYASVADISPEHLLEYQSDRRQDAIEEQDRERRRIEKREADFAAEQSTIRSDARSKTVANLETAEKLSATGVDGGRWWSSRSAGQKFAAFLGAGLDGWLNPGQPSKTVSMVLDQINQDIALQERERSAGLASLTQKNTIIGHLRDQGLDEVSARQIAFRAMSENVIQSIDTYAQQLDPRGSQAVALRAQKDGMRQAQSVANEQAEKDHYQRGMDAAELDRKIKADDMGLWRHDQKLNLWTHPDGRVSRIAPSGGGSGSGSGSTEGTVAAAIYDLAGELKLDADQRARFVVLDAKSKTYGYTTSPKYQAGLQETIDANTEFVDVATRLAQKIQKYGWEPSSERWTSAEGAGMQADHQKLLFIVTKTEKQGALNDGLVRAVASMLGGDPTDLRLGDGEAQRLYTSSDNAIKSVQNAIRGQTGSAELAEKYSPIYHRPAKKVSADVRASAKYASSVMLDDGQTPKSREGLASEIRAIETAPNPNKSSGKSGKSAGLTDEKWHERQIKSLEKILSVHEKKIESLSSEGKAANAESKSLIDRDIGLHRWAEREVAGSLQRMRTGKTGKTDDDNDNDNKNEFGDLAGRSPIY